MASTSSLPALHSCFVGSKVSASAAANELRSPPSCVSFRPLRVSASCAATAERTTTTTSSYFPSSGSLYEVLGIQMGASCKEIKAAYRKLARILHPDVATNGQREDSAHEFMKVHEAYETLSDPEKRADYDRSLFWRSGRPMSSAFVMSAAARTVASNTGYTRRTWETDQCW